MKFKTGDRVVLVKICSISDPRDLVPVGTAGIITGTEDTKNIYKYEVLFDCGKDDAFGDEHLEFEQLYDSPLYKALT